MVIHASYHSLANNNQDMHPAGPWKDQIPCPHIEAEALLSPKDWVMLYVRLKEGNKKALVFFSYI